MDAVFAYWLVVALNVACLVYLDLRSFELTSCEIVLFTVIAIIPGINVLALVGLGLAITTDLVENL